MKRGISFLLLLFVPFMALAQLEWDEQTYRLIEQSIKTPQFGDFNIRITQTGASEKNAPEKNQKAIQKAIDKCAKKGGGMVIVPAGQTFLTGAITIKNHVNLVVEDGAVLQFVFAPELYPIVETGWEGLDCFNISPCIYAFKANDIAITGKGHIDGGGAISTWWPWCGAARYGWKEGMPSQREGRPRLLQNGEDGNPLFLPDGKRNPQRIFTEADRMRPQLIGFNQCDRVLIEDVTLLKSPFWVIHPLKCNDVTVRGVNIDNNGPNGDGCDPESCNRVIIENCYFNTGDDCIAIKSGRNRDGRQRNIPSQNIIVRHCQMKNGHGGVVIGSEISGGCKNVFAHDCNMDSPNLDRVLRIKTNSCRGGVVENIYMRNITVGQCRESVLKINLNYEPNENCCRGFLPIVRNVYMENVTCEKSRYGVQIIALDSDTLVHDVNVRNCRFNGVEKGNFFEGKIRDINLENLFVNGQLVTKQAPFEHFSQWMTFSEMKRTPQSPFLDFSNKPKWSYVMGVELEPMLDTYLEYKDRKILDYCKQYTDTMVLDDGTIRNYRLEDYNLDNIRTGHFIARMYSVLPEEKNMKAMNKLMTQLINQPRTEADGVFWHKAIYAYQVWLDGIFMGLPFYALNASMILDKNEAEKVYDDIVNQIKTTYQRTFDHATGLNRHAWDESQQMFWADPQTGQAPHCWGRAQGWFTMALIEILDVLPQNYSGRNEIIRILQQDLQAIVRWQDQQSGLWFQVMDQPERDGNYLEATCASMFAYALLKAARNGYVPQIYRDAGIKAYKAIINHFIRINPDKTISLTDCCAVAGLGPGLSDKVMKAAPNVKENRRRDGSFNYYISEPVRDNDAKGIGPFIWASLEMEKLGFTTSNL